MGKKKMKDLDPKAKAKQVKGGGSGLDTATKNLNRDLNSVGKATKNVGDGARGLRNIGRIFGR